MSETPLQPAGADYLAAPADLAARLGLPNEAALTQRHHDALRDASARFRAEVNHHVTRHEYDWWGTGNGTQALQLPALNIDRSTITVEIDDKPVTDYQVGARTGQLRRPAGWPDRLEAIHARFVAGWDKPPAEVAAAVLDIATLGARTEIGVTNVSTGGEAVAFDTALAAAGATPAWSTAVEKYQTGAGDRS